MMVLENSISVQLVFLLVQCKKWMSVSADIVNRYFLVYLFVSRHEVHSMNTHTLQNAG